MPLRAFIVFFSLSAFALARAESSAVTVTITQRVPMETLSSSGEMSSVSESTVGAHYALVSSDGENVVLQDAQGVHYRIPLTSTDYQPPAAPTTPPAPTTNAPPSVPPPSTTTAAPTQPPPSVPSAPASPDSTTSSTSGASDTSVSSDAVDKINSGLGTQLFTTQNLWTESGLSVAIRLGLRLEDKTKWETAYRRYFFAPDGRSYQPASILGGKAYCVALYADASDVPTSALIAFTNDGDYGGVEVMKSALYQLQHPADAPPADADKQIADLQAKIDQLVQSFEPERLAEAATLTKNLTALFGDPKPTTFGNTPVSREDALRWDWNGVSFLLTTQENKYNLLRIVPVELADNHGRTERIPRDEMGAKLADAVEHRPNGDVVITQLPMADQGLKGYCVPATWERVLRYTGVPGDMYTLSRIGGAGFGGGESVSNVAAQLDDTLHDYGRRAEFIEITTFDTFSVHRYIDKGIPIFWVLNPEGYKTVEQRYALGDRDKDWDTWKKLVDQSRSASSAKQPDLPFYGGHQVLIIGYNSDTKEIAWSDPWGRNTEERWMTQEEAQRCSLGDFYIITW